LAVDTGTSAVGQVIAVDIDDLEERCRYDER
jgi:hypothetical protein